MSVLSPGSNCSVVAPLDACGVLVDAHLYYRAAHRAIAGARRYVLLSGWQFDSDVHLLRGADAEGVEAPVELLALVEWACERRPELGVYLLAWDFSAVFALEREWFQEYRFTRSGCPRIHFAWDDFVPRGASHHQKLLVVDGLYAFAGGMDLCQSRWDTRNHAADDPLRRKPSGTACKPYHDVQAFVAGRAAVELQALFCQRWRQNTGEPLELHPASGDAPSLRELAGDGALPLPASSVGISQTRIPPSDGEAEPLRQIRQLYLDAVASAERLIYIENQYFTSRSLTRALVERLGDRARSRMAIVIVMPRGGDTPKEKFALGEAQSFCLGAIREAARKGGHRFRIFFTGADDARGKITPTFIHSKILLVDDRLLSIGSANTTNRSFGLDSELNLTWEAERDDERRDIARLRASLLAEHCGDGDEEAWLPLDGLIDRLDAALEAGTRLHDFTPEAADDRDPLLSLATDPTGPVDGNAVEERLDEVLDEAWESLDVSWFRSGLESLFARFGKADTKTDEA